MTRKPSNASSASRRLRFVLCAWLMIGPMSGSCGGFVRCLSALNIGVGSSAIVLFAGARGRRDRLDLCHCRCGAAITDAAPKAVTAETLRLMQRFHQALTNGVSLLPGSSVAAGFWWAERLASAALRTPQWLKLKFVIVFHCPIKFDESTAAWLAAAEMLDSWPSRFLEFLRVFQTVTRHRTTVTGLSRSFGLLLRDAAHLEQLGVSTPADVLRAELLQHYTQGHLTVKCCLFRKEEHEHIFSQRPWITQTEAAKTLGLKHGAVGELLRTSRP